MSRDSGCIIVVYQTATGGGAKILDKYGKIEISVPV
jgi:hypothetical protein